MKGSVSSFKETLNYVAPVTDDDFNIKNKNSTCPLYCFNDGICQLVDMNTGKTVKKCNTESSSSSSCTARCQCTDGWYGNDCKMNKDQLNTVQTLQTNVLTDLSQGIIITTPINIIVNININIIIIIIITIIIIIIIIINNSVEISNNV